MKHRLLVSAKKPPSFLKGLLNEPACLQAGMAAAYSPALWCSTIVRRGGLTYLIENGKFK